eukprot:1157574-Pelagomonas_calceolata.AAC.10
MIASVFKGRLSVSIVSTGHAPSPTFLLLPFLWFNSSSSCLLCACFAMQLMGVQRSASFKRSLHKGVGAYVRPLTTLPPFVPRLLKHDIATNEAKYSAFDKVFCAGRWHLQGIGRSNTLVYILWPRSRSSKWSVVCHVASWKQAKSRELKVRRVGL